jgi:hypothetical protein
VSDSRGADEPADEPTSEERRNVQSELNKLRAFVTTMSPEDLREGAWLGRMLGYSLGPYVHEVDAAYFEARYPDQTADQIIEARIRLAARYAGIEGGISAGVYTGAVAATIGSAGGASPLTLPAAGLSFVLDLLYMSNLQLRLAHDIAVLYRVPLDLKDPEDLLKLIRVAFAVKSAEAGRGAVGKGIPALVRPILRRILNGGTLAAAKTLPAIGKLLLQRNLIKFAIPAVGVPLSTAVNYWSTRAAGRQAAALFRREAAIAEAARQMTGATVHHAELLWVLWLIVKSDAVVHENERLLLRHVTALIGDLDSELTALAALTSTVDVDEKLVWSTLSAATDDLEALYDAGVVAAAVDGKINVNELANLQKLSRCCGVVYDEQAIRAAGAGA